MYLDGMNGKFEGWFGVFFPNARLMDNEYFHFARSFISLLPYIYTIFLVSSLVKIKEIMKYHPQPQDEFFCLHLFIV